MMSTTETDGRDLLRVVAALEPVTWSWRDETQRGEGTRYGFVAQQVAQVLPDLVTQSLDGVLSMNYRGLIPLLVRAVQQLEDRLAAQRLRLDRLEERRTLLAEKSRLQQEEIELLRQVLQAR